MARAFLSGIQVPTLPRLNIDGELTLDAQAGTSGQILTSAGNGATPTWASSFSGFLSTTNTGRTGLISFITPGSSSQATWANYPVGLGTMLNMSQGSNGAPNNNFQYFFKVANRDFGGGWGGLSIDYATGDLFVGRADTSSVYATWNKLANTSLSNTFTGAQTFNGNILGGASGFQFRAFNEDSTTVKFANWFSSTSDQFGQGQNWNELWLGAINSSSARRIGFYLNIPNATTSPGATNANMYITNTGIGINTSVANVASQLHVTSAASDRVGAIIRGASGQTVNLTEWQNNTPTTLASVSSTGRGSFDTLNAPNGAFFGNLTSQPGNGAYLAVQGYAAGQRPFMVRGFGATTANLVDYQNGSGVVVGGSNGVGQIFTGSTAALNTATGGATTATSGTGTVATITTTSAHNLAVGDIVTVAGITPTGYNGTYSVASIPTTTTFTYANTTTGSQTVAGTVRVDSQASITSRSAATVGLLVRAAASQSSNPFEVQNSSGTVIANVTSAGGVRATGTLQGSTISAVADGSTVATLSASGNIQFRGSASYGGGVGVIGIANATTAPSTSPTGGGILFVESGALKYRGTSGSNATIVNADGTLVPGPTGATGPTGPAGADGLDGVDGVNGAVGPEGPAGQGVPIGGSTGQVLSKIDGTNYNTQWITLPAPTPTYTLASGTNNGTLKLTPSSGSVQDNIAVTGLGTAAYTASTAYATSSHTHGNVTNAGAIGSTSGLVAVTTTSGALTVAATPTNTATQFLRGDLTWVVPTDTNWYPTGFSYTGGTTAGPTGSLTGVGMSSVSFGAIPSASASASGIVTTGNQEFGGVKTLNGLTMTNGSVIEYSGYSTTSGLSTITNVPGTRKWSLGTNDFPSLAISVLTSSAATNTGSVGAEFRASGGTTTHLITFSSGTTARGSISVSGTTVTYATGSDYRLKENVEPISDAIERLMLLKPSRFNFIEFPEKVVDGFLAHEAQEVVPESVTGNKDQTNEDGSPAYQGIDQGKLVPLLTAALQEAISKIEALETRLEALENN